MPTLEQEQIEKEYYAQEKMRNEYNRMNNQNEARFKTRLKYASEQGLLLFAKYALVLFLSYIALQFLSSIISGSQNGTNAVLYLNELQNKGYLPKIVNGQVPDMPKPSTDKTVVKE